MSAEGQRMTREEELNERRPILYPERIHAVLDEYDKRVDDIESIKGFYVKSIPPEWKTDIEKAKAIQMEIRQKLEELDGLFKSSAPE